MSARVFFDTNVVVYAVAQKDGRSEKAEALLAGGGVISVQVLNELASVARAKLAMSWADVVDALTAVRALCDPPVPLTTGVHATGLRMAEKYGWSVYDGLIAAAALEAGCVTLYSEDFRHGQVIEGRLSVRNPFAVN